MKKVLIFTTFLIFSFVVKADITIEPPLGLEWGMKKQEVEKHVDEVRYLSSESDRRSHYYVKNPHKKVEGMDGYSVQIDNKYGLVSVEMMQFFFDDTYGTKIKNRYEIMKQALTNKYGEPEVLEYINNDRIGFYDCVRIDKCGSMSSFFLGKNAKIYVGINSKTHNSGNIFIQYTSNDINKVTEEEIKKEIDSLNDAL